MQQFCFSLVVVLLLCNLSANVAEKPAGKDKFTKAIDCISHVWSNYLSMCRTKCKKAGEFSVCLAGLTCSKSSPSCRAQCSESDPCGELPPNSSTQEQKQCYATSFLPCVRCLFHERTGSPDLGQTCTDFHNTLHSNLRL